MIRLFNKYDIQWLQQDNYKSFYLSFLRVAIGLWLLKEILINWPSLGLLYGPVTKSSFTGSGSNSLLSYISHHYLWYIAFYIIIIILTILGIGRWFTALLLFSMLYRLQVINISFTNGGDMTARLLLFYLIFADSYNYFVLFKKDKIDKADKKLQNLLSNLAAFSIMLQLCLSYFASGMAKIMEPLWRNGEAVYYTLSMERFMGTSFNLWIAQHKWIDVVSNYGVLIFEIFFPILIWIKKLRIPLLVTGIFFHAGIYVFLMIYGFQVVFILMYGFFLPNQMWVNISNKVNAFFKPGARATVSSKN